MGLVRQPTKEALQGDCVKTTDLDLVGEPEKKQGWQASTTLGAVGSLLANGVVSCPHVFGTAEITKGDGHLSNKY